MGMYKVNYGSYSLGHCDDITYFNYFEFDGKKYPVGSFVKLNEKGMKEMYYCKGYSYVKGGFRLVDHFINRQGKHEWQYFIGHLYDCTIPVVHNTTKSPDELLKKVLDNEIDETVFTPGELEVTFDEPNYNPSDFEIDGMINGWIMVSLVFLAGFLFKDFVIQLIIQISAVFYFIYWRDRKNNSAVKTQKFKSKGKKK